MIRTARIALAPLALLALVACNKPEDKPAPPPPVPEPATQTVKPAETTATAGGGDTENPASRNIFNTRCSTCHGADGKGHGPASITLNPKPRNYTDVAWQKSVTDDHLREIIVKGGAAVGKSPLMPPNPDLENKPDVVNGLVAIVRSFSGK
jgi:mono/diheme cytochrome c family protein